MRAKLLRARIAFIEFEAALDKLEQEMALLDEDMSPALKTHLNSLGSMARLFFFQANWEIFSPYKQVEQSTLTTKEDGIRGKQQ